MGSTYVGIKCPKHGILNSPIEYASFTVGTYAFSDIPCTFCRECSCYYTTSLTIHVLANPMLNGYRIRKGKMTQGADIKKTQVKKTQVRKNNGVESATQHTISTPKEQPKQKLYDMDAPIVTCDQIYLSNKSVFLTDKCCPQCGQRTSRPIIRLQSLHEYRNGSKLWVTDKLRFCAKCENYYVTPESLSKLNLKIEEKLRIFLYVWPTNVQDIFFAEEDNFYYLPEPYATEDAMPGHEDLFYDMSLEEISYIASKSASTNFSDNSIKQNRNLTQGLDWHWLETNPCEGEDCTLYVHKGAIICLKHKHEIEQATAILKDLSGNDIELNVNHCLICDRYFIHHTVYTHYRKRYGTILGEIKFVDHDSMESFSINRSEESTLHLCGYNVRKDSKLKAVDRQTIIATVIDNGAMTKKQVIDLLRYLIDLNKAKENWELAVEKWEDDLDFTLAYNTENQNRYTIRKIAPYCRNRFVIMPKQPNTSVKNKKCTACRFSQKTPGLIYTICTNSDAPRYYQRCEMCSFFEDTP